MTEEENGQNEQQGPQGPQGDDELARLEREIAARERRRGKATQGATATLDPDNDDLAQLEREIADREAATKIPDATAPGIGAIDAAQRFSRTHRNTSPVQVSTEAAEGTKPEAHVVVGQPLHGEQAIVKALASSAANYAAQPKPANPVSQAFADAQSPAAELDRIVNSKNLSERITARLALGQAPEGYTSEQAPNKSIEKQLVENLHPDLGWQPRTTGERTAAALTEMAKHPIDTGVGFATALPKASYTLGQYAGFLVDREERRRKGEPPPEQQISDKEAAFAAGQLLAVGATEAALPVLDAMLGSTMAKQVAKAVANDEGQFAINKALAKGYAGRVAAHTAIGGVVGSTFAPDDPAVGAIIGAIFGGAHAIKGVPSVPVEKATESSDAINNRVETKRLPNQVTVERPRTSEPAPTEPDFTVETNTATDALDELAAEIKRREELQRKGFKRLGLKTYGIGEEPEVSGRATTRTTAPAAEPTRPVAAESPATAVEVPNVQPAAAETPAAVPAEPAVPPAVPVAAAPAAPTPTEPPAVPSHETPHAAALWKKVEAGDTKIGDKESELLAVAKAIREKGGLHTVEEFAQLAAGMESLKAAGLSGDPYKMAVQALVNAHAHLAGERSDLRAANRAARTDELTGLANGNEWRKQLPAAEADPNTHIVRWDLNGFKDINDAIGHDAADQLLKLVGQTVRKHTQGIASRMGGDEFGAIVHGTAEDALRLKRAVEQEIGVQEVQGPKGAIKWSISGGVGPTSEAADAAARTTKSLHKLAQGIPDARGKPIELPPELEKMAQFAVDVHTPGLSDKSDQMAIAAKIKALPEDERAAVRARIKLIIDERAASRKGVTPRTIEHAPDQLGAETKVALSNGQELAVRYAVLDAHTLVASHNPVTFDENPAYPRGVQLRAYHGQRGTAAREATVDATTNLNPTKLLDAGSSVSGPPVVTVDGYSVIGNQRLMMLQRAIAMVPDRYAAYRDELRANAARYGIDPATIDRLAQPVLVRVLDDKAVDPRSIKQLSEINRVSDIADTKSKDAGSEGASRALALLRSPEALDHFAQTFDPQLTITDYLGTKEGVEFTRLLVTSGVIAHQELGRFIDPRTNSVTTDGANVIKNMMYAAAVQDADLLERAPKNIKAKLEQSIPAIVSANLTPGYEIGGILNEALALLTAARAAGVPLKTHLSQADFLETAARDERAVALAQFLDAANRNSVSQAFRSYATMAREGKERVAAGTDMFGYTPPTPGQMLADIFRRPAGADDEAPAAPAESKPEPKAAAAPTVVEQLRQQVEPTREPSRETPSEKPRETPLLTIRAEKPVERMTLDELKKAKGELLDNKALIEKAKNASPTLKAAVEIDLSLVDDAIARAEKEQKGPDEDEGGFQFGGFINNPVNPPAPTAPAAAPIVEQLKTDVQEGKKEKKAAGTSAVSAMTARFARPKDVYQDWNTLSEYADADRIRPIDGAVWAAMHLVGDIESVERVLAAGEENKKPLPKKRRVELETYRRAATDALNRLQADMVTHLGADIAAAVQPIITGEIDAHGLGATAEAIDKILGDRAPAMKRDELPGPDATAEQLSAYAEREAEHGYRHDEGVEARQSAAREAIATHPFWNRYLAMSADELSALMDKRERMGKLSMESPKQAAKLFDPNEPMLQYGELWPLIRNAPDWMRAAMHMADKKHHLEFTQKSLARVKKQGRVDQFSIDYNAEAKRDYAEAQEQFRLRFARAQRGEPLALNGFRDRHKTQVAIFDARGFLERKSVDEMAAHDNHHEHAFSTEALDKAEHGALAYVNRDGQIIVTVAAGVPMRDNAIERKLRAAGLIEFPSPDNVTVIRQRADGEDDVSALGDERELGVPDTITFHSGASTPPDIRGTADSLQPGGGIGVNVAELTEKSIDELARVPEGVPVFVDSGAFAEFRSGKEITDEEWRDRLSVYKELADILGNDLYVVAPDKVGDQAATIDRLKKYWHELQAIGRESNVLIPVQLGERSPEQFWEELERYAGHVPESFIPALPMNEAAMTPDQAIEFVNAVQPTAVHLLGMGAKNPALPALITQLHEIDPNLVVMHDANALRAKVGTTNGPGGGPRELTRHQQTLAAEGHDAFTGETDNEFGTRADYTEAMAAPSTWLSKPKLGNVAAMAGLEYDEAQRFVRDPDAFMQEDYGEGKRYDDPQLAAALDQAWKEHLDTITRPTNRAEAVRRTFSEPPTTTGEPATTGSKKLAVEPNQELRTESGRIIQFPDTRGPMPQRLAAIDTWLLQEGREEAKARGDEHVLNLFNALVPQAAKGHAGAVNATPKIRLTQSDRDTLNDYLFGSEFGPQEKHIVRDDVFDEYDDSPQADDEGANAGAAPTRTIDPNSRYAGDENPDSLYDGARSQAIAHARTRDRLKAMLDDVRRDDPDNAKKIESLTADLKQARHLYNATLAEIADAFGSDTAKAVDHDARELRDEGEDEQSNLFGKPESPADVASAIDAASESLAGGEEAAPGPTPQDEADRIARPTLINATEEDIPFRTAEQAYYSASMDPQRRAKRVQRDYIEHMAAVEQSLIQYATTPELEAQLREELERYRQGYVQRELAVLAATSRTANPMVTGPANFPTRRNQKAMESEHRRMVEFSEWQERAQKAMHRKFAPPDETRISADDENAVERIRERLALMRAKQDRMVKANAIIRAMKLPKQPRKEEIDALTTKLRAAGLPDDEIKEAFRGDLSGKLGFPSYHLRNHAANIERNRKRLEELEKASLRESTERMVGPIRLVESVEDNRIRLFFPAKPDEGTRQLLQKRGFKWAPSVGAWQRQLTDNARYAAHAVLRELGHDPGRVHDQTPTYRVRETEGPQGDLFDQRRDEWPFRKIAHLSGYDRTSGAHKTIKGDVTIWRGSFEGQTIEFRAEARLSDPNTHFVAVSSNARIRGEAAARMPQFLDIELRAGELTDEQLQRLAEMAVAETVRGGTNWPVNVRRKGEPVRQGVGNANPEDIRRVRETDDEDEYRVGPVRSPNGMEPPTTREKLWNTKVVDARGEPKVVYYVTASPGDNPQINPERADYRAPHFERPQLEKPDQPWTFDRARQAMIDSGRWTAEDIDYRTRRLGTGPNRRTLDRLREILTQEGTQGTNRVHAGPYRYHPASWWQQFKGLVPMPPGLDRPLGIKLATTPPPARSQGRDERMFVHPVYANITNPLRLDDAAPWTYEKVRAALIKSGHWTDAQIAKFEESAGRSAQPNRRPRLHGIDALQGLIEKKQRRGRLGAEDGGHPQGFDGIVYRDANGVDQYIAFHSDQIFPTTPYREPTTSIKSPAESNRFGRRRPPRPPIPGEDEYGRVREGDEPTPNKRTHIMDRFYSRLERAIEAAPFEKGTADQWKAALSKDVAAGEREWTGIDRFLATTKGVIPKARVRAEFEKGRIKLIENGVGPTRIVTPPLEWAEFTDDYFGSTNPNINRMYRGLGRDGMRFASITEMGRPHPVYALSIPGRGPFAVFRTLDEAKQVAQSEADDAAQRRESRTPKYEQFTEPGGDNYRELRINLDVPARLTYDEIAKQLGHHSGWTAKLTDAEQRKIESIYNAQPEGPHYTSGHFGDEPNILVWARVKDRTLPNGEKVLFIEELQSDWHQKGRKLGFALKELSDGEREELGNLISRQLEARLVGGSRFSAAEEQRLNELQERERGSKIPDSPFKKTEDWIGLAMKRLIDEAVREGYDRIAWTTGEQQAKRYDLSKHVDELRYDLDENGKSGELRAYKKGSNGRALVHSAPYTPAELDDVIGKEMAAKLLAAPRVENDAIANMRRAHGMPSGIGRYRWNEEEQAYLRLPDVEPSASELHDIYPPMEHDRYVLEYDQLRDQLARSGPQGRGALAYQNSSRGLEHGPNFAYMYPTYRAARAQLEAQRRTLTAPPTEHRLSGVDLKVGGEGMKGFYDDILPKWVKQYAKKLRVPLDIEHVPATGVPGQWVVYDTSATFDNGPGEHDGLIARFQTEKQAKAFLERNRDQYPDADVGEDETFAAPPFTVYRPDHFPDGTELMLGQFWDRDAALTFLDQIKDDYHDAELFEAQDMGGPLEEFLNGGRFLVYEPQADGTANTLAEFDTQHEAEQYAEAMYADHRVVALVRENERYDESKDPRRRKERIKNPSFQITDELRASVKKNRQMLMEPGGEPYKLPTPRTAADVQGDLFTPEEAAQRFRAGEPARDDPDFQATLARLIAQAEAQLTDYEAKPLPGIVYSPRVRSIAVEYAVNVLRDTKAIALMGQRVQSEADIAALHQLTRNPFYETFRFGIHKDGKLVAHTATSSRLAGVTDVFKPGPGTKPVEALARAIKAALEETGGDGWHIAHNHPSGMVKASQADKDVTAMTVGWVTRLYHDEGKEAPEFHGHIIVNHNKYSVLKNPTYDPDTEKFDAAESSHELPGAETPDPFRKQPLNAADSALIGLPIYSADNLATAIRSFEPGPENTTLIWLDAYHRVSEVGTLAREWLVDQYRANPAQLADAIREHGSTQAGAQTAMLLVNETPEEIVVLRRLMQAGVVLHGAIGHFNQHTGSLVFQLAPLDWIHEGALKGHVSFGIDTVKSGADADPLMEERTQTRRVFDSGAETSKYDPHGRDIETFDGSARSGAIPDEGESRRRDVTDVLSDAKERVLGRSNRDAARAAGAAGAAGRVSPRVRERDLFGNESTPPEQKLDKKAEAERDQTALFGAAEGGPPRALNAVERAARAELAKLRDRMALLDRPANRANMQTAGDRIKTAKRIAELEKFLNRDQKISAEEMRNRVIADQEPPAKPDDLFGGDRVREVDPNDPLERALTDRGIAHKFVAIGTEPYVVDPKKRLAVARRRIAKEQEDAGLFRDVTKFQTPEERAATLDEKNRAYDRLRAEREREAWEKNVARFDALPAEQQQRVLAKWNDSASHRPKTSEYFADLMHTTLRDEFGGDRVRERDEPPAYDQESGQYVDEPLELRSFTDPFTAAVAAVGKALATYKQKRLGISSHPMPEPTGLDHALSFTVPDFINAVRAAFFPESYGPEGAMTGGNIRHRRAEQFRETIMADAIMRSLEKHIEKQSRARQIELWDAYEQGTPTGDKFVDAMNQVFRDVTQKRTDELIKLDRLRAERAIANYIGRFWTTEKASKKYKHQVNVFLRSMFAKRPFEGTKSFLKHRTIEFMTEGLDRGLIPATYNYVTAQKAKLAEMDWLIGSAHILKEEVAKGRAKIVMNGYAPPRDGEGNPWVKIDREGNDPAFTLWGPGLVAHWEGVDAVVYGKLQHFLDTLKIPHERRLRIEGAGVLGRSDGSKIETRFAGPEGVIMHELGHVLDFRYGLKKRIEDAIGKAPTRTNAKGKQVPDYSKKAGDTEAARKRRKQLREELRQMANLRREQVDNAGKGRVPDSKQLAKHDRDYLHSWPEKMANMVDLYISGRDRFKQVAPGIFEIFDKIIGDNPELHPLRDIRPSVSRETHTLVEDLGGPIKLGEYYAPRSSAYVWRSHLGKGLHGNPIYRFITAPHQSATQLILGFSGFHGTVIATEGAFSDMVLALDKATAGDAAGAGQSLVDTVVTPATTGLASVSPDKSKAAILAFGKRIMEEYKFPGTHPELANVIADMILGGFRGTEKSELWTGDRVRALKRAFKEAVFSDSKLRQAWGLSKIPLDTLYAGIELLSAPLMSRYVPLMKTVAVFRAAALRGAELPNDLPLEERRAQMWDIVKEMDLRFGQVVYDNYFINNVAKHLAQALFLAPGWTIGTLSLLGRGIRDFAAAPKRAYDRARGKRAPKGKAEPPILGRSAKYWIMAVIGTMLINAIWTALATGTVPGEDNGRGDGWKDFFAFRDGTYDDAGNANRHTIPGYLMHDIYGWSNHPYKTFLNKLSPFYAFAARVARNETFYGDLMYDPDDPFGTKVEQVAGQFGKEMLPLSLQNFREGQKRGETGLTELTRNAFGVTPAKREFVRTEAQNQMAEYLARRGHNQLPPDEAEARDERGIILQGLRGKGTGDVAERINRAIAHGELTEPQLALMMKRAGILPLAEKFKSLPVDQALDVYRKATPWEKAVFTDLLNQKLQNAEKRTNANVKY